MRAKLAFEAWPKPDRQFWADLTTRGHPLDPAGALSHLRPATLDKMMVSYGRWLFWLGTCEPSALEEAAAARITEARVLAWIGACAELAAYSRKMYLDDLIRILVAIDPDRPTRRLRLLRKQLNEEARINAGGRKIGRIPSAVDLVTAGLDYADAGVAAAPSAFERARRLRDAAMVVVLAMMPVRRRNFATLELGRTVLVAPDFIEVTLPADEVKNARTQVFILQDPAAGLLRRYLAEARPFLAARNPEPTAHLWLADTGRPYALNYLTTRITRLTERLLGMKVPPHFFRDAVATTLARASAELARGVPAILGHTTARTAERHYNQARMIEAGWDYAEVLKEIRSADDD